jgi:hypothetical protein
MIPLIRTYLPPVEDADGDSEMRFRLTYEGELKASGRDPETGQRDRMAGHKQAIRKVFHGQLKRLWETNRFLSEHTVDPALWAAGQQAVPANQVGSPGFYFGGGPQPQRLPLSEAIANLYRENNYRFVPATFQTASSALATWIIA